MIALVWEPASRDTLCAHVTCGCTVDEHSRTPENEPGTSGARRGAPRTEVRLPNLSGRSRQTTSAPRNPCTWTAFARTSPLQIN